jgi:hypothetical protein
MADRAGSACKRKMQHLQRMGSKSKTLKNQEAGFKGFPSFVNSSPTLVWSLFFVKLLAREELARNKAALITTVNPQGCSCRVTARAGVCQKSVLNSIWGLSVACL